MLHREENSGEAEIDDLAPRLERVFCDEAKGALAGVGNGDVEATKTVDSELRCCLNIRFVGHVAANERCLIRIELGQECCAGFVDVGNNNRSTLGNETSSDRFTDATRGARDERYFSRKCWCHCCRA